MTAEAFALRQQVELWKANYLEQVELHNKTLDDLAIAERELAALKAGQSEWEDAVLGQHSITYTSAPRIPEGWQLIPIEPTNDMLYAVIRMFTSHTLRGQDTDTRDAYQALLLAAPKQGERE